MERIGKYLSVREVPPPAAGGMRKTCVWEVFNHDNGARLGTVKWHGAWRCYVFRPEITTTTFTVFHDGCLREIADFLTSVRKRRIA